MKTVSKRLFSVLLAVILLVSAVPFQASAAPASVTFSLTNPHGSTMTATKNCDDANPFGTLPAPSELGFAGCPCHDFVGWFTDATYTTRFTEGDVPTSGATYFGLIVDHICNIKVYYTLDDGPAQFFKEYSLAYADAKGKTLLSFANDASPVHPAADLGAALVAAPLNDHYTWDTKWYDYDTKLQLTDQIDDMLAGRAIFAKLYAKEYTLTFNPNAAGATVSPTSKIVKFNHALGDMPVPTCPGKVFVTWNTAADGSGANVTKDTIYDAGYTTVYAQWADEAEVYLRIYVNDDLTTPKLVKRIFGKKAGDNVTQAEAKAIIDEFYHGYTAYGLFDQADYNGYVSNPSTAVGQAGITVQTPPAVTNAFVHIKNAQSGSVASAATTTAPATTAPAATTATTAGTSNNSKADKSNPKTGDSVMIEAAVGIMVLAAAAFITMEQLRKHKKI